MEESLHLRGLAGYGNETMYPTASPTEQESFLKYEWWQYFIIPWVAGIVGYVTNVLSLEMMFYPVEFFGIEILRIPTEPWGLIGWQGVVPTKAKKMASVCFDLMTEKLLNVKEIFGRLNPDKFSAVMEDGVLLMMDDIINDVAEEFMGDAWNNLPKEIRNDIVVTAEGDANEFLAGFMADLQNHCDDVMDLKAMSIRAVTENKRLLIKMFQECGDKEFTFIRNSGFYFGFLFGIGQMCLFFFYDKAWVLPAAGFIVGWFTNFVALKIIFKPIEPVNICGYQLQGIFLKRQKEVSEIYARVLCTEIVHIKAMFDDIFVGPLSGNFYAMLRAHTLVFTDKMTAELKPLAIAAMGAEQFAAMKEAIAQKVMDELPNIIDQCYEYATEALGIEAELRTKMMALSCAEFEGVLHPAFEEDEILLIIVGAVLGAIVGVLQIFTIFQL
ncbi:expressed unknown protein [Seminavis robusta]|uniref:DUF445 domain-containing protein n=1 Tax=Seminavis robusta TaxID=568900 RepID=A0A9N8HP87_9STRA|nr:expressed unknown protein [Seminavis robusta]|eukprot:Sro1063_g237090.1 n/a (441) ;mRNA; r:11957-13462